MAVNFENQIPDWKNEGTEPPQDLKDNGFYVKYKPAAAYFNWFWNFVFKSLEELQTKIVAKTSIVVSDKLLSKAWLDGVYEWSNPNIITSDQIIELVPASGITAAQLEALQLANIVGKSQKTGSVSFKAYGEVPKIDIPVTFIIRGVDE